MSYIRLDEALFKRILGKKGEEPRCAYPGCGVLLSEMVDEWGENVSRTISRGKTRYWCRLHNPEANRY